MASLKLAMKSAHINGISLLNKLIILKSLKVLALIEVFFPIVKTQPMTMQLILNL